MKETFKINEYDKDEFVNAISHTIETFLNEKGKLSPKRPVLQEEKEEFIGQIIDIFEDFLDEKGIVIPNKERDEDEELDAENSANIYGNDYDILYFDLSTMLSRWKIIN